jgi:hypothetical protein
MARMGVLRFVVRIGIFWAVSLLIAVAGLELGHRVVMATDRGETTGATEGTTSAVSVGDAPPR